MKLDIDTAPDIVRIIRNSKIYGAQYDGDKLLPRPWDWPTDGYLTRRLRELRGKEQENE